jgi:protein SCO1
MRRAAAAAVAAACAALVLGPPVQAHGPHEHGAAAAPPASSERAPRRPGADYFPNVELTTQDGKKVRFYDDLLKGKSVGIVFMFTSCQEVCPLETANMVQLRRLLGERAGRDLHLYSITLDPQNDTPEALKAYAEKFDADWTFLTGAPEDIKLIGKKLGMLRDRVNPTSRVDHHAAYLMLGNEPTGQWTKNSAVDNPRFLRARIGTFLGWRDPAPARSSYADAKPVTVHNGQRLFASKCSACHTVGKGEKLGPDLAGVTDRREREWLARYIADPVTLRDKGDPIASALYVKYRKIGMPYLGLGASDVEDLVTFLATRSKPEVAPK